MSPPDSISQDAPTQTTETKNESVPVAPSPVVEKRQSSETSHLLRAPVILGVMSLVSIVVIAMGTNYFGLVSKGDVPQDKVVPTPTQTLETNIVEDVTMSIEYAKGDTYGKYSPDIKVLYLAGTNIVAKSVSWQVCDSEGKFVKTLPLKIQNTIPDPLLKGRRWTSGWIPALEPGKYIVTVVAESQTNKAMLSFGFDPMSTLTAEQAKTDKICEVSVEPVTPSE